MRFNRYSCIVAIVIVMVFLALSAGSAHTAEIPRQISSWGIYTADSGGEGVAIKGVITASPAAEAGLRAGDVLLSIDGLAVRSAREFSSVKNSFPLYTPLKLAVRRSGTLIEIQIMLKGLMALTVKELNQQFVIPGVPDMGGTVALSAIDALDQINVLDQVVIDPQTGRIEIIGHYDKNYDTGPIPYLDLLKTALVYPEPSLNLHPTAETKKEIMVRLGLREISYTFEDMVELVRTHPGLERDRQMMIRELAKSYRLTPEEYVAWYNYVKLEQNKEPFPPPAIRDIQVKVFASLGYSEVAKALQLSFYNTQEELVKALQVLGRGDEAKSILSRGGGEAIRDALLAATYLEIFRQSKTVKPEIVAALGDSYNSGNVTLQSVLQSVQDRLMPYNPRNGGPNVMNEAFNRITLSSPASLLLDKVQPPYSYIEALDLDPRSQLARIMYEADYALKSLTVAPELFTGIPGSRTKTEYRIENNKISDIKEQYDQVWLQPGSVSMAVSPGGRVLTFSSAEILCSAKPINEYFGISDKQADRDYDDWFAERLTKNYEAYARIVPVFHKLREAAKVIALARWALEEKFTIDLSAISPEKWNPPVRVPAFWTLDQAYFKLPNGSYNRLYFRGIEGGVSFKAKGKNWFKIAPAAAQSETRVADQLSISAALGQKAVQAAQGGDLEQARHLAELSAQAMTGGLSRNQLAAMNIAVPEASPTLFSPVNVRLQKELIKKTRQQIVAMGQNPSDRAAAASDLARINSLYVQVLDKPAAASDYLLQLQTGRIPSPTSVQTKSSKPSTDTICGESSLGDTMQAADRKDYLSKKLSEARDRLKYINEALKKLIAINAAQRAEIDKQTAEITEQYNEAKDRAWDVVFDLLTSVSLDAFGAEQVKRVKGMEDAIKGKISLKTTPMDSAALLRLEEEIKLLQSTKFRLEDTYVSTQQLVDTFKGTKYGKDIDDWRRKNQDAYDRAKSGLALVGNIALDHPTMERWLGKKAFFYGEKLWHVAAMGKMAYYAWGFYLDILTQQAIWEPMTIKMQNELKYNVQAMEHLQQSAKQTSQEIGCMKTLLK